MNTAAMIRRLRGRIYTVKRFGAGAYDDATGLYVPGTQETLSILASLQPLSPREIVSYISGDRTRAFYKFYTAVPMQVITEPDVKDSDVITIDGETYRLLSVEKWPTYFKSILVLENDQAAPSVDPQEPELPEEPELPDDESED